MSWATLSAATNRVAFARLGSNTVSAGAVTGSGFLAINSELELSGDVVMIDYMLTILTNQFGNLGYGDLVTVDGAVYKVELVPMPIDDGTFSKIPLMKTENIDLSVYLITQDGRSLFTQDGRFLIAQPT